MRLRALALLLLAYVSVEFSNPLMPGAVSLLDGSLEAVLAQRTVPPATAATMAWRILAPRVVIVELPRPVAPGEPRRIAPVVIRRAPPQPPPPTIAEDD
jgi:hypothetical protein